MENLIQIVSVPIITVLVYGAMELYKFIANNRESFLRLIPVVAVVMGVVLGVVAFYAVPDVVLAE